MTVMHALENRASTRAFLDKPIEPELLKRIFEQAQRAPSNCNVQPWQTYVLSGKAKDRLKQSLVKAVMSGQPPNPDFNWSATYQGIHRERQFDAANTLYSAMDISRDNKLARQQAMLRNWQFFDAPHVAFFTMDKYLDIMGAVDLGIYAQSLALLLTEHGLASCMQGALGQFPDPVRAELQLSDQQGVLFGMSFGYADQAAAANQAHTQRAPLELAVHFHE